jgi:putative nucleotidyltransferase with HDIG domain
MIKAILFDWGDTVMRVFPQFRGAMVDWPIVESMPGIVEACSSLSRQHQLYIATNAADSNAQEISRALARVGVDTYFSHNFTSGELGCTKPSPLYYQQILSILDLSPDKVIMVGDDIHADILGSDKVGIKSIWIHQGQTLSLRQHPAQSAEIRSAESLVDAIKMLQDNPLHSLNECFTLLKLKLHDPKILRHDQTVALSSYLIARICAENRLRVNPILAHRGGLLHDLDKLQTKKTIKLHGVVASKILADNGYPELARIALCHPAFSVLDPDTSPTTWEEKIVFLADKIVEGDKIVGVKRRLMKLHKRYPENSDAFQKMIPIIQSMEDELLANIRLDEVTMLNYLNRNLKLVEAQF